MNKKHWFDTECRRVIWVQEAMEQTSEKLECDRHMFPKVGKYNYCSLHTNNILCVLQTGPCFFHGAMLQQWVPNTF